MMQHTGRSALLCGMALLAIAALGVALPAGACPVPVYQYALEWWAQDPYEIYVFDTGDLTEDQQACIDRLEAASQAAEGVEPANLRLRRVQHPSVERLHAHSSLQGQTPESLPWMVVYYPSVSKHRKEPVWIGALNRENIDALLDSPVRRRICELLIERISVVWVVLESGDGRADDAAATLIEQELGRLEKTLTPPDLSAWGAEDVTISDIAFRVLRLSRDDAAERMLVAMLMHSEHDLEAYADKPMVFPIFGRGLIMSALIGDGINAYMIRKTAEFLTGPCSCTVKSINPGTDLITTTDWNGRIEPMSVEVVTGPGGLGGFLNSMEDPPDPDQARPGRTEP